MLYSANNYNNENIGFLDIITFISFILQVQNRESHMIAKMDNELSQKIDKQINAKLDKILFELDEIKQRMVNLV